MRHYRGFTLIELLVVIAIIGILSSVVLASLNTARSKGNDAAVRSNLANARAQAELFYDDNGDKYVGTVGSSNDVCAPGAAAGSTQGIYQFVAGAASASGVAVNTSINAGDTSHVTCHATPSSGSYNPFNAWAIEAPLKGTYAGYSNPMYCVDSSGIAVITSGSTLAKQDAACN
jgi:prepilin-type N-terminal cleavage/methylation domain-containing protein